MGRDEARRGDVIVIKIDRSPPPVDLEGPGSKGMQELENNRAFFTNASTEKPKFSAYKLESVRAALMDTFKGKCAYCESIIGHISPEDIEHFRPKGKVQRNDGSEKDSGYWWLAARWENLLTSCIMCNRPNKVAIVGVDGNHRIGKGILFPLLDEEGRAENEGEEATETPLLINPCDEDPEEHLGCIVESEIDDRLGLVQPTNDNQGDPDAKGEKSIEIYGLNRSILVDERKKLLLEIKLKIKNIRHFARMSEVLPPGEVFDENEDQLLENVRVLQELTRDDKEYLLLVRQVVRPFLDEFHIS